MKQFIVEASGLSEPGSSDKISVLVLFGHDIAKIF
jgi:hypothetical protein